jgi:hypothetical protein
MTAVRISNPTSQFLLVSGYVNGRLTFKWIVEKQCYVVDFVHLVQDKGRCRTFYEYIDISSWSVKVGNFVTITAEGTAAP